MTYPITGTILAYLKVRVKVRIERTVFNNILQTIWFSHKNFNNHAIPKIKAIINSDQTVTTTAPIRI